MYIPNYIGVHIRGPNIRVTVRILKIVKENVHPNNFSRDNKAASHFVSTCTRMVETQEYTVQVIPIFTVTVEYDRKS